MSEETKDVSAKAGARRRLIRGAFAAPAALTLFSGSAFAQASNMRCVANAIEKRISAPSNPADTWLRVPVYRLGKDDKRSTWVSGADMPRLKNGHAYLNTGEWQCLNAGSNSGFKTGEKYTNPMLDMAGPKQTRDKFVALRVDASGKIIGVEGLESGGAALSVLCWNSLAGLN